MSDVRKIAKAVNFTIGETETIAQINTLQKDLIKLVKIQILAEKQKVQQLKLAYKFMTKMLAEPKAEKKPRTKKPAVQPSPVEAPVEMPAVQEPEAALTIEMPTAVCETIEESHETEYTCESTNDEEPETAPISEPTD
jgi:hypothetical protein